MKHESQSPVQYKSGKQNNPSQFGFLERYLRIFIQKNQFIILEGFIGAVGWGGGGWGAILPSHLAFSLMSLQVGSFPVSSVLLCPTVSWDQFFLHGSFLFLGHSACDFASILSIRLVCPAAYWIGVCLYALEGYIKLNLSQAEAIIPFFMPFNLLWYCLHERALLSPALLSHSPDHCFDSQSSSAPSSWGPCLYLYVSQITYLAPCPLPPSCSGSFCFFRIDSLSCMPCVQWP